VGFASLYPPYGKKQLLDYEKRLKNKHKQVEKIQTICIVVMPQNKSTTDDVDKQINWVLESN
jgi:hypothetical protein